MPQAGYVNSYVDYGEKIKSGKNIHKLFIDPNNQLNVYKIAIDRGILKSTNTALQSARIVVKDTYGNESFLTFKIQHSDMEVAPIDHEVDSTDHGKLLFNKLNVFEKKDIRIAIPQNALFDNIDFHYTVIKSDSCTVHFMINQNIPYLNAEF